MLSDSYKSVSVKLFGGMVDRNIQTFQGLKPSLLGADIPMLLKTWLCVIFSTTTLVYFASLVSSITIGLVFQVEAFIFVYLVLLVPVLIASMSFFVFYIYPVQRAGNIRRSIDTNLPFALTHLNAIASSGIPPEYLFELVTGYDEYGHISRDAESVVRNIRMFGMSSVNAIKNVAEKTPSEDFRQVLSGMVSIIEGGGDLASYISEMAEKALFEYKIKREKYLKTLSTYADIYTALVVAAPLMMLSVLAIMRIIGGAVLGLSIGDLIFIMTWIMLPALNVAFLVFIHITYPGV